MATANHQEEKEFEDGEKTDFTVGYEPSERERLDIWDK